MKEDTLAKWMKKNRTHFPLDFPEKGERAKANEGEREREGPSRRGREKMTRSMEKWWAMLQLSDAQHTLSIKNYSLVPAWPSFG